MGYTKNENGDLVIVQEEAEIVRLIFRLYLEGYSAKKISQYLEENGIKTATGQDKWYDSVIFKMLRNEKYMGDALLQKTYTVDFMTKKKVINKGIVLSRDKIMNQVWGFDYEGESRTVDMHIKTLRQKLGEAGSHIKTVRNVGYMVE